MLETLIKIIIAERANPMNWFNKLDATGYELIGSLPPQCIEECSGHGEHSHEPSRPNESRLVNDCLKWIEQLEFNPPESALLAFLVEKSGYEAHSIGENPYNISRNLWMRVHLINMISNNVYNKSNSLKRRTHSRSNRPSRATA